MIAHSDICLRDRPGGAHPLHLRQRSRAPGREASKSSFAGLLADELPGRARIFVIRRGVGPRLRRRRGGRAPRSLGRSRWRSSRASPSSGCGTTPAAPAAERDGYAGRRDVAGDLDRDLGGHLGDGRDGAPRPTPEHVLAAVLPAARANAWSEPGLGACRRHQRGPRARHRWRQVVGSRHPADQLPGLLAAHHHLECARAGHRPIRSEPSSTSPMPWRWTTRAGDRHRGRGRCHERPGKWGRPQRLEDPCHREGTRLDAGRARRAGSPLLTAVAYLGSGELVAANCRRGSAAGIFDAATGSWRLVGPDFQVLRSQVPMCSVCRRATEGCARSSQPRRSQRQRPRRGLHVRRCRELAPVAFGASESFGRRGRLRTDPWRGALRLDLGRLGRDSAW